MNDNKQVQSHVASPLWMLWVKEHDNVIDNEIYNTLTKYEGELRQSHNHGFTIYLIQLTIKFNRNTDFEVVTGFDEI